METQAKNMATITVRLIRSFEYRNMKTVVLQNVDLDISIEEFKVLISAGKVVKKNSTKVKILYIIQMSN
jgi:hypothetical protein